LSRSYLQLRASVCQLHLQARNDRIGLNGSLLRIASSLLALLLQCLQLCLQFLVLVRMSVERYLRNELLSASLEFLVHLGQDRVIDQQIVHLGVVGFGQLVFQLSDPLVSTIEFQCLLGNQLLEGVI
jgi:hypothetical protein